MDLSENKAQVDSLSTTQHHFPSFTTKQDDSTAASQHTELLPVHDNSSISPPTDVNQSPVTSHQSSNSTITIAAESITQIEVQEQFVALVQDGQTYTVPLSSYAPMQTEQVMAQTNCAAPLPILEAPAAGEHEGNAATNPTFTSDWYEKPMSVQSKKNMLSDDGDNFSFGYMASGSQILKKPRYKIIQNISSVQKKPKEPETKYKPINVDNWGIFLIGRVQNYFKRKELCDLTIRFPECDSQIQAHKLILCACSEMFANAEKKGTLCNGYIDMPPSILPEAVAQIIKFMYSGRLEVDEESFDGIYKVAMLLEMAVVVKMLESQRDSPSSPEKGQKRKREDYNVDTHSEAAVRKFKKMEMKVKEEEMQIARNEKIKSLQKIKQEQDELEKQKLPGKKLPIWKRKDLSTDLNIIPPAQSSNAFEVAHTVATSPEVNDTSRHLENKAGTKSQVTGQTNSENRVSSINLLPDNYKIPKTIKEAECDQKKKENSTKSITPVVNTYQRRLSSDKPKIPRKIREMHEHLMFEKILKTGSKNTLFMKSQDKKDETVLDDADIKGLSKEHEERVRMIQSEDDAQSEYCDNETELRDDHDDDLNAEHLDLDDTQHSIDVVASVSDNAGSQNKTKAKINLDNTIQTEASNSESDIVGTNESLSLTDVSQVNLDDALEEFAKEVEEDQITESRDDLYNPRRGRPPKSTSTIPDITSGYSASQQKIIQAVLEKNPELLKSNKPIQIKVARVENGKKTVEMLTVKPLGNNTQAKMLREDIKYSGGNQRGFNFKPLEKVCYSGRKGRPRKLKPGDEDPHAEERQKIKETLSKTFPSIAKLVDPGIKQADVKSIRKIAPKQEVKVKFTENVEANPSLANSENQTLEAASLNPGCQTSNKQEHRNLKASASIDQISGQALPETLPPGTILVQDPATGQLMSAGTAMLTPAQTSSHLGATVLTESVDTINSGSVVLTAPVVEVSEACGLANDSSVVIPTSTSSGVMMLNTSETPVPGGVVLAPANPGGHFTLAANSATAASGASAVLGGAADQYAGQVVHLLDTGGQDSSKYVYVMDLKSLGGVETASNSFVLPFANMVPGNVMQSEVDTSQPVSHHSISQTYTTPSHFKTSQQSKSQQHQPAESLHHAAQHITIDQGSLIPVTIGGISGVLPASGAPQSHLHQHTEFRQPHQQNILHPQQKTKVGESCSLVNKEKNSSSNISTSFGSTRLTEELIVVSPVFATSSTTRTTPTSVSIVPTATSSCHTPQQSKTGSGSTIQININLPHKTALLQPSPGKNTSTGPLGQTQQQLLTLGNTQPGGSSQKPGDQVFQLAGKEVHFQPEGRVVSRHPADLDKQTVGPSPGRQVHVVTSIHSADAARPMAGPTVQESNRIRPSGTQQSAVSDDPVSSLLDKGQPAIRKLAQDWDSDGEA